MWYDTILCRSAYTIRLNNRLTAFWAFLATFLQRGIWCLSFYLQCKLKNENVLTVQLLESWQPRRKTKQSTPPITLFASLHRVSVDWDKLLSPVLSWKISTLTPSTWILNYYYTVIHQLCTMRCNPTSETNPQTCQDTRLISQTDNYLNEAPSWYLVYVPFILFMES